MRKILLSAMPKNKRKKRLESCPNRIGPQYCRRSPSAREQRFQNAMDGWLQQMSLFFDGHPIPALAPQFAYRWLEYTTDPKLPPVSNYALEYHLRKTDENRDAWFDLVARPGRFSIDRPLSRSDSTR